MPLPTEFDRLAAITLQGGGVYGISLIGQLQAVLALNIKPIALAGTSAGAIVAALYWAGLKPSQIQQELVALAESRSGRYATGLTDLLGKFEPAEQPFTFRSYRRMRKRVKWFVLDPIRAQLGAQRCAAGQSFGELILTRAEGILNFVAQLPWWVTIGLWNMVNVYRELRTHISNRGMFCGSALEAEIDRMLRRSPLLQKYQNELPSVGTPLCFEHFNQLAQDHPEECFFPPLFLTATNLTSRKLELFDSMDPACRRVPVARAVRASAGFPFAFRPIDIPAGPGGDWFVDGGVISNFPAWVFNHEFRRRLATIPDYQGFAPRTWFHIGLRLIDDLSPPARDLVNPRKFLRSIFSLFLYHARNELENRVTGLVTRSVAVQQPLSDTSGPDNLLDVDRIDRYRIESMITRGERFAADVLRPISFSLPPSRIVQPILEGLIEEVRLLFGEDGRNIHFRSNVFVPQQRNLVLVYRVNMDGDPDHDLVFHFNQGLTGFCFTRRVPLICNLASFADLIGSGKYTRNETFGFDQITQSMIRSDQTWLASAPIFDPYASYPRELADDAGSLQGIDGLEYSELPGTLDGALFGVLNLDAALPYDKIGLTKDPKKQWHDPRIRGALRIMRSVATEMGRLFSESFARR